MGRSKDGIRLKIDVTPSWWKTQTDDPESFAEWCVKAIRVILETWTRAEIRLSREKVVAAVSFDGETRAGLVKADKDHLRKALDEICEPMSAEPGPWRIVGGTVEQWKKRVIDANLLVAGRGLSKGDVQVEPSEPPFTRVRGITFLGVAWLDKVDKS